MNLCLIFNNQEKFSSSTFLSTYINLYQIKLCRAANVTYTYLEFASPHVVYYGGISVRKRQTRESRNCTRATAWNKEKSRKGKKEIKEAAARCRHLDHGTHFASLISRKDSVRVTGVFRLQGLLGTRGSSPLSYGLVFKFKNESKPTDSFSLFSHRPCLARGVS